MKLLLPITLATIFSLNLFSTGFSQEETDSLLIEPIVTDSIERKTSIEIAGQYSQLYFDLNNTTAGVYTEGLGFHIGIGHSITLSPRFDLNLKMLIFNQRTTGKGEENKFLPGPIPLGNSNPAIRISTNYLMIPVLVDFRFLKKVSFETGGFGQFLLFNNIKYINSNGENIVGGGVGKENVNQALFGVSAGFNYHMNDNLKLGLSYGLSLSNWNKNTFTINAYPIILNTDRVQTGSIQFSLSYKLF